MVTRLCRLRGFPLGFGLLAMIAALGIGGGAAIAQTKPASAPRPLKVAGTQVVDSRNQRVPLRGVNAASMEWSSDGEGHILQTVQTAIRDWHANIIRLPLAQD